MNDFLSDLRQEFQRHKSLADRAMSVLTDEEFFRQPGAAVNSVALIVKHLAGNLVSRWTDFLTTDGEKPDRNRDGEFVLTDADTRPALMATSENGWHVLNDTLAKLSDADLNSPVQIRGESHSARQAMLRGLTHVAYHVGQIVYLARLWQPESPWLTIAPRKSGGYRGQYLGEICPLP